MRTILGNLLAASSALVLAACAGQPPAASPTAPAVADPPAVVRAAATPAQRIERLGAQLLGQLGRQPGNLVLSPTSLHATLTLLQGAAAGVTARELDALLGGPADEGSIDAIARLRDELGAERPGVTLRSASGLFVAEGHELAPSYLSAIAAPLHARVEALRFDASAAAKINAWASEVTDARIQEIVPAGELEANTAAVLVDALFLRGTWATPFAVDATKPAPFALSSGTRVELPTMHAELTLPFAETELVEVAQLPYQDGRLALAIVLPKRGHSVEDALGALASGALAPAFSDVSSTKLAVALPRFTVEGPVLRLKRALRALGVDAAFSEKADFGRLLQTGPPLVLADVLHRVVLEVDERGARAAAASAAHVKLRSRPLPARPFAVDHPFLFVLRDQTSGTPLFVGRIENPKS